MCFSNKSFWHLGPFSRRRPHIEMKLAGSWRSDLMNTLLSLRNCFSAFIFISLMGEISSFHMITYGSQKKPENRSFSLMKLFKLYQQTSETTTLSRRIKMISIRPGKIVNDAVVTDLRALRYNWDGTIDHKLDFDSVWAQLPQRTKDVSISCEWPQLFHKP